jgi:hypothetical protein
MSQVPGIGHVTFYRHPGRYPTLFPSPGSMEVPLPAPGAGAAAAVGGTAGGGPSGGNGAAASRGKKQGAGELHRNRVLKSSISTDFIIFFFEFVKLETFCFSFMFDEVATDAALARLFLPDVPVLLDTSFEILAQVLFNEDAVCPHQETDTQSNIQHEQTQEVLHQLQQELNVQFECTVNLLEENRETRVQSVVYVLCQADQVCCPPHSSGGVFSNPKSVKSVMDKFDRSTQSTSSVV